MRPLSYRSEWVWIPVVLAVLAAVYLPGLGNLPVFDDAYLTEGTLLKDYGSFSQWRTRMLSYGSFVWVQALFGDGWWKQRLVNLGIHVAVVVALWGFYREILRHVAEPAAEGGGQGENSYARSPALGVAIGFFALNPVAVYAVAYLIQRSILMATLFVVLGLWAFARALATANAGLHFAALACYALALMSKEYALFAPLAAVPVYILVARPGARKLASLALLGTLLIAAAGFVLSQRYGEIIGKPFDEYSRVYLAQLGKLNPDAERHAFGLSILNEAYLFFHYGARWFMPWSEWMSISLRPPFPLTWATFPHALGILGYLGILIGAFAALIRYRDWRALVALSFLLPALLFMTEFVTVWVQDPFVLYRSYLWGIGVPGIVFCLVHGASWRSLCAIGAVLGALLAWQALDRIFSLETPQSAWTDAIAKLPRDPRAVGRWFPYLNRGAANVERNDFAAAMRDFDASNALGDMGMGAVSLGSLLSASGRQQQALAAFDRAEQQGYDAYNLPFQRGRALQALGRPAEAYRQFEIAASMNPPSPTRELVLLDLGRSGLQAGRNEEAIRSLDKLVQLDPRHAEGRFLLAMALISRSQNQRALELLEALVKEKRGGAAYYGRALANYGLKRKAEALADIEAARRIGPDNANLREWQAKIMAMP